MSTNQPLAVDFVQEDSPLQILPNLPLLSSYQSKWQNVHFVYHRQPALELPEISSNQHILILPKPDQVAGVEVVIEGQVRCMEYSIKEHADGCCCILPARQSFELCWNQEVEFLHCYIEPDFIAQIAHESVNPDRVEISVQLKQFDQLIQQMILNLKADLEVDGMGDCFYADSLGTTMAAHLVRHYSTRKHSFRSHDDGLSQQKLNQAIEYINEHMGENLSLTTIADELNMSHYYFCRLFKRSTGMTAHQYLIQQRIERAKRLLKQPELTITEIALECGFTHPSHLAKYFRRHTGLTPTQFRQL